MSFPPLPERYFPVINSDRLLETFLSILRIDSYYPNEDPVMEPLRPKLESAGVQLTTDEHRNVLGYWPGSGELADREPVMLCAHTDTVWPTPEMEPVVRDNAVHTDGSSVLGADDKAAVAAIVEAVEAIAEDGMPHPPVEVLFTVGEEIGHIGSRAFDVSKAKSKMVFVPDADGTVGGVMLAAPWTIAYKCTFHGRAAHAGMDPENGRSALCMIARAIETMRLGRLDEETTANVGTVNGGEAMNIVPPTAEMVWQLRSLDEQKYEDAKEELMNACRAAAEAFGGTVDFEQVGGTRGFRFNENDQIIERAKSAIAASGIEPWTSVTCGGSDANEFNENGLPAVVISVGYLDIHTNEESMPLDQLHQLTDVCCSLMLGK